MPYFSEKLGKTRGRMHALLRIRPTKQECRAYNNTDRVLLTFDDEADGETVARFLDILHKENVKAAFFLVGKWAAQNPEVVESIRAAGHWVGNHTYSHCNLAKLSSAEVENEINREVKGELLRPPFGVYDNRIRKIAAQAGYHIAFWTVDSDDWKGISAPEIQKRVLEDIHPGACVLLHLNGAHTLEALPGLIKEIRSRGFELCDASNKISL